jgi:hypothetical protein
MQKTVAKPSSKHPQAGLPEYKTIPCENGFRVLEFIYAKNSCKNFIQTLSSWLPNNKPSLVRMGLGF